MWEPPGLVGWPLAITLLAFFIIAAVVFLMAFLMFMALRASGGVKTPQGKTLTTLQAKLRQDEWVWPFVGVAFLIRGALQVAVA